MRSDAAKAEESRFDLRRVAPGPFRALAQVEREIDRLGVERGLRDLIKVRASQINGCEFCRGLHSRTALSHGESVERLDALAGWRQSSLFDARARAMLALAEHLNALDDGLDQVRSNASRELDDAEIAAVVWTVATINAWNRVAIAGDLQLDP